MLPSNVFRGPNQIVFSLQGTLTLSSSEHERSAAAESEGAVEGIARMPVVVTQHQGVPAQYVYVRIPWSGSVVRAASGSLGSALIFDALGSG